MKIGLVIPNIPAYSETFFVSKINGLFDAGFEIVLFVGNHNGKHSRNVFDGRAIKIVSSYSVSGCKFWQIIKTGFVCGKAFITDFAIVKRFCQLEKTDKLPLKTIIENIYISAHILKYNLDWLHFGFATMGLRRENVAKAIGAKCAVSFRGYDVGIYPVKNKNCYQHLWTKLDKVHTISNDLLDIAYNLGLSKSIPVSKITPAINFNNFVNSEKSSSLSGKPKIISIGRLTWKKGFEYALSALSILNQKGVDFEYCIIGEGEDKERLIFAAYQLGITDKVHFLGKINHTEVADYLKKSDIYLQPSVQEGFCNAVLEAQAAGLLCIVSNAEGLPENVLNEQSGWVVEKRNPQAIADKILNIINMKDEERQKITTFAGNRVKNEFTTDLQISKFVEFYGCLSSGIY